MAAAPLAAKVLTVSDGVAEGRREDRSGAALVERLTGAGYDVVEHRVSADGVNDGRRRRCASWPPASPASW